jgi:glycerol kinase
LNSLIVHMQVFSAKDFQLITYHQVKLKLLSQQAGWVEMDPQALIDSIVECMEKVAEYLSEMGLSHKSIKSSCLFSFFYLIQKALTQLFF